MPAQTEILQQVADLENRGVDNPFDRVRRHYIDELHNYADRDLILYSTAWTVGGGAGTSISEDDVHSFMDVVHGLRGNELDLILHSPGGSPTVAEQIVSYLRDKFDHIRIFVPQSAMSAATLMCCAADVVVMGRHSSLGPIDPQMHLPTTPDGHTTPAFAVLDQFEVASEAIESHADAIVWEPMLEKLGPGVLAKCHDAIDLSKELAKEWAETYMHRDEDDAEAQAEALATFLSDRSEFKSHSRRIDRDQARTNGFNVEELEADDELQDLVLSVFHSTMLAHKNAGLVKILENQNGRNSMTVRSSE